MMSGGRCLAEYEAMKPVKAFVLSVLKRTRAALDEARNSGGSPPPQYVRTRLALSSDEPSHTVTESKHVASLIAGSISKCSNVNNTFCSNNNNNNSNKTIATLKSIDYNVAMTFILNNNNNNNNNKEVKVI